VAQTFFVDPFLKARTFLDSITTVVDAKHIRPRLADSREAREQIAFADQIVLNKTELVAGDDLRDIEARLRRLNPLAPIHRAQRANVALDKLLGRGGFALERIVSLEPNFLEPDAAGHAHDEHGEHDHHDHAHDDDIGSIALTSHAPMNGEAVGNWLERLVATQGQDILRAKGIIDVSGEDRRLVFQAVHMLLEGDWQRPWKQGEQRLSRLVFIGRNLDRAALQAEFDACAADDAEATP
jgi:G3E family GTPase